MIDNLPARVLGDIPINARFRHKGKRFVKSDEVVAITHWFKIPFLNLQVWKRSKTLKRYYCINLDNGGLCRLREDTPVTVTNEKI